MMNLIAASATTTTAGFCCILILLHHSVHGQPEPGLSSATSSTTRHNNVQGQFLRTSEQRQLRQRDSFSTTNTTRADEPSSSSSSSSYSYSSSTSPSRYNDFSDDGNHFEFDDLLDIDERINDPIKDLADIDWYENTTSRLLQQSLRQQRHQRRLQFLADDERERQLRTRRSNTNRMAQDSAASPKRLPAKTIPKYVTELFILPILYDDGDGYDVSHFPIALRQFRQQVLPLGYPSTELWGYGNPYEPWSFHHPSGTMEVTHCKKTYVTWLNELLVDPIACHNNDYVSPDSNTNACNFLPHVLQDKYGTPIIDTSLHWAAPDQRCLDPTQVRTDCFGPNTPATNPYFGPVPMVTHVHGAHVESRSDGYPEAWFLPRASNIPEGFATHGTFFKSRYLPYAFVPDEGDIYLNDPSGADDYFLNATQEAEGKGYAVFRYSNDNAETTTLWYHDHSLGMTRLNVYAAGAGFWSIRTAADGDLRLAARDSRGQLQQLPGPPPQVGQNPNVWGSLRQNIREIGLAFKDADFYDNGRLFYPANRVSADYPECADGTTFAGTANTGLPFLPDSDVSPVWNPEVFFSSMLVNGKTFPRLNVAPERYRFKLLNTCDSRTLNLALRVGSINSTEELPFFVIGSDQGLLPEVVQLRTGFATKIVPGWYTAETIEETPTENSIAAMLMGPSERYDVIVDFADLEHGTEVYLINTGPDFPFGGFGGADYVPADPETSGQVMKFIVNYYLQKSEGDTSTSPYDLVIKSDATTATPDIAVVRDLSVFEFVSTELCVEPPVTGSCTIPQVNCSQGDIDPLTGFSSLSYGPIHANLGVSGRFGPGRLISQQWMDPIRQNPALDSTEIWEFWNWTGDGHPLHVHLVHFRILGRYDMKGNKLSGPELYESGRKDTVIALPGQVTRIQITFDRAGLYVWHCHILSHEDNAMMLPYCVGRKGIDCPAVLF